MKKLIIISTALVYIIGCIYLILPSPISPELDNSVRSDEPGDTWQNPDQKGFYTNLVRKDVLTDLQDKFSINIAGFQIPSFRLNYRTEEVADYVRKQVPSYYLEEIIYPLRESLFVSGWEPKNSPQLAYLDKDDIKLVDYKGTPFFSKVITKPVYSSIWSRLLVWTLIIPATYLTFISLKRSLKNG